MTELAPSIRFSTNDYAMAVWESIRSERGLVHSVTSEWIMDKPETDFILQFVYQEGLFGIFQLDGLLAAVSWSRTSPSTVFVAGSSLLKARAVMQRVLEMFPPQTFADKDSVPVAFWSRGSDGYPRQVRRNIAVPKWDDISYNYPPDVSSQLDHLMDGYQANPEGGKLILWTGHPGTGKTYALRALAREWQPWCDTHMILDPESFFTGSVDYLFQVALNSQEGQEDRWRLIVCEDTGELLSADAKDRSGSALARFLNLCDGIVGQGLRIQILITTNEDIRTFHSAVTRPGRAVSQIRFEHFSAEQAAEWLGGPIFEHPKNFYTLADLYAIRRGEDEVSLSRNTAGFLVTK